MNWWGRFPRVGAGGPSGTDRQAEGVLHALADLKPETLAVMHGSSYIGKSEERSEERLTGLAGVNKGNFNHGK